MRAMLFSPMWVDGLERQARHLKWQNYYKKIPELDYPVFLVDNNSPQQYQEGIEGTIHRCQTHLTRVSHNAYGYWYRAFRIAIERAINLNLDKIIHIDTDAFILKKQMVDYVNGLNSGWTTFWCPKYSFPEASIQVICKDQFEIALDFFTDGFLEYYPYDPAENILPFTHVEKGFCGDRYGETYEPQRSEMDYYCQATINIDLIYKGDN